MAPNKRPFGAFLFFSAVQERVSIYFIYRLSIPVMSRRLLIVLTAVALTACDMLGLGPDPRIAQREAEAKAIGAACRYGLRSIEDCYALNKGINKAFIYSGWLEMDGYMRENKIEGLRSEMAAPALAEKPAAPKEEIMTEPASKAAGTTR